MVYVSMQISETYPLKDMRTMTEDTHTSAYRQAFFLFLFKHYKVNVILIGEVRFRRLIFKNNNICTQSEFWDFSYENLEQVKSKRDRLVSPKDSAGLSLDFFKEV